MSNRRAERARKAANISTLGSSKKPTTKSIRATLTAAKLHAEAGRPMEATRLGRNAAVQMGETKLAATLTAKLQAMPLKTPDNQNL